MAAAREAGIRTGPIHRYSLCQLATDQAANFIRHVPRRADALPPVVWLDYDDRCPDRPTRALLLSALAAFLAQIEAHMGKRDGKRDVWGKRGEVRVDLGVRRVIKKKKDNQV